MARRQDIRAHLEQYGDLSRLQDQRWPGYFLPTHRLGLPRVRHLKPFAAGEKGEELDRVAQRGTRLRGTLCSCFWALPDFRTRAGASGQEESRGEEGRPALRMEDTNARYLRG